MTDTRQTGAPPTFSVIIPTYDRPAQLAVCLESLTRIDYPPDRWQVIVVDDGSPGPLETVVTPFRDRLPRLTLLWQENAGPARARNTGAAHADGEFLAFTDDDCAPDRGWLRALAAAAQETPEQGIGGRTVNALLDDVYAGASQLLIDFLYDYYNRPGAGGARFFASNNLCFPAAGFQEIGGFDVRYQRAAAEDRGLCDRWLAGGRQLRSAEDAVVHHHHAMRLRDFWRQHFHYGAGAYHFHRLRAATSGQGAAAGWGGRSRPRLEPPVFYLGLMTYAFRTAESGSRRSPLLLAALMGLSQVATAAGYFAERSRTDRFRRAGTGEESVA